MQPHTMSNDEGLSLDKQAMHLTVSSALYAYLPSAQCVISFISTTVYDPSVVI